VSARRKARKRALDVLFSADINEQPLAEALSDAEARSSGEPERSSSWAYAREIVQGLVEHDEDVDRRLRETSQSWPLERMPTVDRAVLRVATWEILYNPDLVNELSTEASSGFVHGILAAIAKNTEVS